MRTATERDYARRILRVLVHVQNHLDEELDLDALAALACFSRFHFHRIFRGMVGESVAEYVRRLRLERAARQLLAADTSVLALALEAGYESHEAFTRAFRARFGMPPSGFRSAYGDARRASAALADALGSGVDPFEPRTREGREMEARIEKREPVTAAFLRHVGPYEQVGATWQELCAFAGRRGLFGPNTVMFGASYDDPEITPADKLRYDACIAVPQGFAPEANVGVQTFRGGEYAVATLKGPYSGLAEHYATLLGQWLPAQGREPDPDAPCLEFYKNDPNQVPAEELETEVWVPLRG